MNDSKVLLGSVAAKLEANGFIPTSVNSPGNRGVRHADDEAGILLGKNAVALAVCVQELKLHSEILTVLKKLKLANGPSRIASDGSRTFIYRWDGYGSLFSRVGECGPGENEPALALLAAEHVTPTGEFPAPIALRVGGEWLDAESKAIKDGLLSVQVSELPALDDADNIFAAVAAILDTRKPSLDFDQLNSQWKKHKRDPNATVYERTKLEGGLSALTLGERATFQGDGVSHPLGLPLGRGAR